MVAFYPKRIIPRSLEAKSRVPDSKGLQKTEGGNYSAIKRKVMDLMDLQQGKMLVLYCPGKLTGG